MINDIKGFHLEPTNICTLQCPGCDRTQFIKKFPKKWTNKNLNLNDLKKFLDIDISSITFSLCGNNGDPIYYPQLFDLVDWIKENKGNVHIHTNGSYKTQSWWKELSEKLDKEDKIVFAIDGLPENFTQYRINADWDSILVGIKTIQKTTKIQWQYIPFSYNIEHIEKAKTLSMELGFDDFKITNSDRWDENPLFIPSDKEYMGHRFDKIIQWKNGDRDIEISAKCKIHKSDYFITADGYFTPCCFSASFRFYYSSEFYKNKSKYKISNTTFTQVMTELENFYQTLESKKFKYCTFNCPKI